MFAIVARSASDEAGEPVAGELDERADDAERPEHLGHDEDEVGRGRAARQLAGQPDADDPGHGHVDRLAEQRRLGLDPADAPGEHAEAVDHRRVRVGADDGVRERDAAAAVRRRSAVRDDGREELEVDLVDDARAGRDDAQVAERRLGPAQELVALAVALVLAGDVEREGARASRTGRPGPSGR